MRTAARLNCAQAIFLTLSLGGSALVSKLLAALLGNKEVRFPFAASSYLVMCRIRPGSFASHRQVRVLILGLDNAGKTTILYKLQMGEVRLTK